MKFFVLSLSSCDHEESSLLIHVLYHRIRRASPCSQDDEMTMTPGSSYFFSREPCHFIRELGHSVGHQSFFISSSCSSPGKVRSTITSCGGGHKNPSSATTTTTSDATRQRIHMTRLITSVPLSSGGGGEDPLLILIKQNGHFCNPSSHRHHLRVLALVHFGNLRDPINTRTLLNKLSTL